MILGAIGAPSSHVSWQVLASVRTTGFALGVDAVVMVACTAYLVGWVRTRAHGGAVWQAASFVAGLAVLFVAAGSGLVAYDTTDPTADVVQHVLLMMVAPPLIALGRPGSVLGAVARARRRSPEGRSSRIAASWGAVTGVGAWPVYYGSMGGYFLTAAFAVTLRHPVLLDATEAIFVAVGLVFWSGMVGRNGPAGRSHAFRIGAVVVGMPVETAVGLALMVWPTSMAPGVSLAATHGAGLALWLASMATSGVALAVLLARWCIDDSRQGALLDAWWDATATDGGPAAVTLPATSPVSTHVTRAARASLSAGPGDGRSRP